MRRSMMATSLDASGRTRGEAASGEGATFGASGSLLKDASRVASADSVAADAGCRAVSLLGPSADAPKLAPSALAAPLHGSLAAAAHAVRTYSVVRSTTASPSPSSA